MPIILFELINKYSEHIDSFELYKNITKTYLIELSIYINVND